MSNLPPNMTEAVPLLISLADGYNHSKLCPLINKVERQSTGLPEKFTKKTGETPKYECSGIPSKEYCSRCAFFKL